MATFTEHLRDRGTVGLAALLAARPDLTVPPPSGVRALVARATSRASLERALAGVDATVLAVLEAALALDDAGRDRELDDRARVDPARLAAATGAGAAEVARAVAHAVDLALLWPQDPADPSGALRPSPGLGEVLGPYPAGLGPSLRATLARRSADALARLATDVGAADASPEALATHLPGRCAALLADAPVGARQVLDALTWGPPVGRTPEAPQARAAVDWLLRQGLLAASDPQHVVLPREVALALRDGRTHAAPALEPPPPEQGPAPATVDAEATRHAEEAVRLTAALVELWSTEPPAVLRAGGLGVRELRRTAGRLGVDEGTATLLVEVAGAAGLVVDDGDDPPSFLPTTEADEWLRLPVPERWQVLAEAWLGSERAAWLVGTRDERGGVRAALDPENRRPWAPRLRRSTLDVVARGETWTAPDAAAVHEVLAWRTPRSTPPEHAVEAVLAEAAVLGVLGAGALGTAGRALLASPVDGTTTDPTAGSAARALGALMPAPVDDLLLQGDLTGIVPGRPSDALGALVDASADVESRGAALTVRFTEASVRRALDTGRSAEDLLAELSRHARSGVPQPLEYLVLDTARRHGQVRVGMAASYLRSDDPTLLAGLTEDRSLHALGLLRLAPTVLAAQVPPSTLVAALRERGVPAVVEAPDGQVLHAMRDVRRARRGRRSLAQRASATPSAGSRPVRLAADLLRSGYDADVEPGGAPAAAAGGAAPARTGTPDPVEALALLREAAADGREVWIDIVDPAGGTARRRVRPLRVDAGRVRAVDAERESELTVAVHRIADVTPV